MTPPFIGGVVAATATLAATSTANLFAQLTAQPENVTIYTTAAATTTAVAALVFVVRQVLGGNLVPRSSADVERKQAETIATLVEIVRSAEQREDRFYELLISRGIITEHP